MRKALILLLLLFPFVSFADQTITWGTVTDGSQTTGYDPVGGRSELNGKFTPSEAMLYGTAHIWLYKVGTPASINIGFRNDCAGVPCTSLGSTTVSATGITTGSCAEYTFPMLAENLTAGVQYWFFLQTVAGVTDTSNYFQVCFENADPDYWGDWSGGVWGGVNIDYRGYLELLSATDTPSSGSDTDFASTTAGATNAQTIVELTFFLIMTVCVIGVLSYKAIRK